jgi:hypothetical protein
MGDNPAAFGLGKVGREISSSLCVRCKGYKLLCGLPKCPLIVRFRSQMKVYFRISNREISGSTPPSGVVGESDYPRVPVFVGIPPNISGDEASIYDSPEKWWGVKSLEDIIELRSSVVATLVRADVRRYDRLLSLEIPFAMVSTKPVDIEAIIKRASIPTNPFHPVIIPHGLLAIAEDIRIGENPRVPREVEKIHGDELRASEAIWMLYSSGASIYTIQRALSFGLLGLPRSRRLVPTRWAITAVDSIISLRMLRRVRTSETVDRVELYRASYLGNRFWVILFPGTYSFEWIEIWHPSTIFHRTSEKPIVIRNREGYSGEALFMDGGYQAARLAVLEHLYRRGRRASIMVVREITPEYYASVGNWHIRETVRRALNSNPEDMDSLAKALKVVNEELLASNIAIGKRDSRQKTLDSFFIDNNKDPRKGI